MKSKLYPDYEFLRDGTIYSYKSGKVLKPALGNYSVPKVNLMRDGRQYNEPVHRIIAKLFIPNRNPTKFTDVIHKDGNKLNNAVSNLKWATRSEAVKQKLKKSS